MLTPNQEKYLQTIPADKKVVFKPYSSRIQEIAHKIIAKINSAVPELQIAWIGASALGISGQDDIDLNILSTQSEYHHYLPKLKQMFDIPVKENSALVKWEFNRDGYDVELYLTDRDSEGLKEQVKIFEMLRDNPLLLREYEQMKQAASSLPFREYMRRKYEFFNKVLCALPFFWGYILSSNFGKGFLII